MSWEVFCDDFLIYKNELEDYQLFEPKLSLELNKIGGFDFSIYPQHPCYDQLKKLKSIITVKKDGELFFRGRILNDSVNWYNERQVTCEGELAFLIDSIQRPFHFPVDYGDPATPADYFEFLIERHNEQVDFDHQFVVGNVTVTDPNNYIARSDTEYQTTWELLNDGLLNTHGGYLWVDNDSNGNRRINYYSNLSEIADQTIEFGKNLLDIMTERCGEEIATAILPLGATNDETEERLTISALPDETTTDVCKSGDIVYSAAAESLYGHRITKVVVYDDITMENNLLVKAKLTLGTSVLEPVTTTLSSVDLSAAGYDFDTFKLGTNIIINSPTHESIHSINPTYLVEQLHIDLTNPANNKLTVGATILSFVEENKKNIQEGFKRVEANANVNQTKAIRELEQRTDTLITQTESSIYSSVSENYYLKSDGQLIESKTTEMEQNAEELSINFETLRTDFDDYADYTDEELGLIRKYIRFVDGQIILGEVGNPLTLKIENDRIAFLQNNTEVAFFSENKLYVTDGEFINSLRLGSFAFIPRDNGNLSFKKVVS